jgi:phosphodiesterase/alkaline phosphatase D-like protein
MEKSNSTAPGECANGPCAKVGRNYTMSFIKFHDLKPSTKYSYRLKSGGKTAAWSDTFTFRTPVADGKPSKLGVYGDMGVYAWNDMQNLQEDCRNGDIDAIVHVRVAAATL